jgi:hypothetical protein
LQCLREVLPASSVASEVIDDCSLVVSELTSNAVTAGSTVVSITVEVHRDHVRIAADDGPGVPRPVAAGPSDPHGRGLAIVDSLSRAWGVQHRPRGKQVWADVAIPSGLMFAVDGRLQRLGPPWKGSRHALKKITRLNTPVRCRGRCDGPGLAP